VLATSVLAVASALVPPMITHLGASPGTAWRVSALLLAIVLGAYAAYNIRRVSVAYRAAGLNVPVSYRVNSVLAIAVIVSLILCATAIVPDSVYRAALSYCLCISGVSFLRVFLSIAPD
jgi:hypothetical protein